MRGEGVALSFFPLELVVEGYVSMEMFIFPFSDILANNLGSFAFTFWCTYRRETYRSLWLEVYICFFFRWFFFLLKF